MSTWPTARLEKLGTQRASLGNYANMFVYTRDYENLLKTNCGNLHHRPGDPKKLLCSSKSAPVCQHEVLKKKNTVLQWSHERMRWNHKKNKVDEPPSRPCSPRFTVGGRACLGRKNPVDDDREDGKPKRGPTGNLKLCTGKRAVLDSPYLSGPWGMESGMNVHF